VTRILGKLKRRQPDRGRPADPAAGPDPL